MRVRSSLATFAFFSLAALPAQADWGGIPYGISVAELQALLPSARENTDRSHDVGTGNTTWRAWLTADYQISGIAADVYFEFDLEGRLRQVDIAPKRDVDCGPLVGLIRQSYGALTDLTEIEPVLRLEEYHDLSGNNLVILNVPMMDTSCSVKYRAFERTGVIP